MSIGVALPRGTPHRRFGSGLLHWARSSPGCVLTGAVGSVRTYCVLRVPFTNIPWRGRCMNDSFFPPLTQAFLDSLSPQRLRRLFVQGQNSPEIEPDSPRRPVVRPHTSSTPNVGAKPPNVGRTAKHWKLDRCPLCSASVEAVLLTHHIMKTCPNPRPTPRDYDCVICLDPSPAFHWLDFWESQRGCDLFD